MLTDKLFTGQQREPEALSGLMLYNYGARFYSPLTGRFLSPDPLVGEPGDPQTLNRYSYVRNNPLRYVDPLGLAMAIVCPAGHDCEAGEIEDYEEWVIAYWIEYGVFPEGEVEEHWDELLDAAKSGVSLWWMLAYFDVMFINTEPMGPPTEWWQLPCVGPYYETLMAFMGDYQDYVEARLQLLARWDVVLTYSMSGPVVAWLMRHGPEWQADAVIFVEPAFNLFGPPRLDAADFPGTRILTLNAPGVVGFFGVGTDPGGTVKNAINLVGSCGDKKHCTMQFLAPLAIWVVHNVPLDVLAQELARTRR